MHDAQAFLAALQLTDSAFPIGRFVHSYGLEACLAADRALGEEELTELIESVVSEAVAPLDGAVLAHAHRATDVERLLELDRLLTARKLSPSARLASQTCGRQLAALAPELVGDRLVTELARRVHAREADANLAVVEGTLGRALGLPREHAVLLELRGAAASLLSATIRLGRLSPVRAQVALRRLGPAIERAGAEALATPVSELRSTSPELEIYAMTQSRADARLFST